MVATLVAGCTSPTSPAATSVAPPPADSGIEPSVDVSTPATLSPGLQSATRYPAERYADLEIVTLLPQDAIPAIDDPQFLTAAEADEYYDPDELVIGVVFGDEARAYSVPYLNRHEIVNDTAGPIKFAVTW